MPNFKNVSGVAVTRPGDGEIPTLEVEDGEVIEADTNPAPGLFAETDDTPPEPVSEPEPQGSPESEGHDGPEVQE